MIPYQRFYIKRGYIPDGKGVYYEEKYVKQMLSAGIMMN